MTVDPLNRGKSLSPPERTRSGTPLRRRKGEYPRPEPLNPTGQPPPLRDTHTVTPLSSASSDEGNYPGGNPEFPSTEEQANVLFASFPSAPEGARAQPGSDKEEEEDFSKRPGWGTDHSKMLEIIAQNPSAFSSIGALKDDLDFVAKALKTNPKLGSYLLDRPYLFLAQLVAKVPEALPHLPPPLMGGSLPYQRNPQFLLDVEYFTLKEKWDAKTLTEQEKAQFFAVLPQISEAVFKSEWAVLFPRVLQENPELKNDKRFALKLMGLGYPVSFMGEKVKKDKEVIKKALENGYAFWTEDPIIRQTIADDQELALLVVQRDGNAIRYLPKWHTDEAVASAAVHHTPKAMLFVKEAFRFSRIAAALFSDILTDPDLLKTWFALTPKKFWKDSGFSSDIMFRLTKELKALPPKDSRHSRLIELRAHVLKSISTTLWSQGEFVKNMLALVGSAAFPYIPHKLQSDRDIILVALSVCANKEEKKGWITKSPSALWKEPTFVKEAFEFDRYDILNKIPPHLYETPEVLKLLVERATKPQDQDTLLRHIPRKLWEDPEFVSDMIQISFFKKVLPYIPPHLRNDGDLVITLLSAHPETGTRFIPDQLKSNREFCERAIGILKRPAFEWMSKDLRKDPKLQELVLTKLPSVKEQISFLNFLKKENLFPEKQEDQQALFASIGAQPIEPPPPNPEEVPLWLSLNTMFALRAIELWGERALGLISYPATIDPAVLLASIATLKTEEEKVGAFQEIERLDPHKALSCLKDPSFQQRAILQWGHAAFTIGENYGIALDPKPLFQTKEPLLAYLEAEQRRVPDITAILSRSKQENPSLWKNKDFVLRVLDLVERQSDPFIDASLWEDSDIQTRFWDQILVTRPPPPPSVQHTQAWLKTIPPHAWGHTAFVRRMAEEVGSLVIPFASEVKSDVELLKKGDNTFIGPALTELKHFFASPGQRTKPQIAQDFWTCKPFILAALRKWGDRVIPFIPTSSDPEVSKAIEKALSLETQIDEMGLSLQERTTTIEAFKRFCTIHPELNTSSLAPPLFVAAIQSFGTAAFPLVPEELWQEDSVLAAAHIVLRRASPLPTIPPSWTVEKMLALFGDDAMQFAPSPQPGKTFPVSECLNMLEGAKGEQASAFLQDNPRTLRFLASCSTDTLSAAKLISMGKVDALKNLPLKTRTLPGVVKRTFTTLGKDGMALIPDKAWERPDSIIQVLALHTNADEKRAFLQEKGPIFIKAPPEQVKSFLLSLLPQEGELAATFLAEQLDKEEPRGPLHTIVKEIGGDVLFAALDATKDHGLQMHLLQQAGRVCLKDYNFLLEAFKRVGEDIIRILEPEAFEDPLLRNWMGSLPSNALDRALSRLNKTVLMKDNPHLYEWLASEPVIRHLGALAPEIRQDREIMQRLIERNPRAYLFVEDDGSRQGLRHQEQIQDLLLRSPEIFPFIEEKWKANDYFIAYCVCTDPRLTRFLGDDRLQRLKTFTPQQEEAQALALLPDYIGIENARREEQRRSPITDPARIASLQDSELISLYHDMQRSGGPASSQVEEILQERSQKTQEGLKANPTTAKAMSSEELTSWLSVIEPSSPAFPILQEELASRFKKPTSP